MSRYDKERIIGTGTFGNVWLVKSKLSRHAYVLKEIDLKCLNETDRQLALNEVTVLQKCQNKHIIRYKDYIIQTDLKLSIIMEYAEGGDLHAAILKQRGIHFGEHRIVSWFIQICLALQYIHYKNIVHRDLKSQNIFLSRNKLIKVGDFGIARVLQNPEDLAKTAVGTPYYLSPEICQRKPYNHKTDIWALGVILYEMAALEHPFQAADFIHLVTLILSGRRKELPRHCSALIQNLVKELLDLDPEKRPSTEIILAKEELQPYLSEYMLSYGFRESFLPVLISPTETRVRGSSVSDIFENIRQGCRKKRRSNSASELNKRIPEDTESSTSTAVQTREPLLTKTTEQENSSPWKLFRRSSRRKVNNVPKIVINQLQESTSKASGSKIAHRLNKRDKREPPLLTASCDTFTVPKSTGARPKYKLTKSEDPKLVDSDHGYQSCNTHSPANSSNKENKASFQNKMQHEKFDPVFDGSKYGDDSAIQDGEDDSGLHSNCQHSQCHQCMLDMLWKNMIRCPSVNTDEYSKLRNKLLLIYDQDSFGKIYQSLLCDWGGNTNVPSPNLLNMMQSLNFEQVQSLPLMMQLVQIDLFLKSKRNG